MQNSCIAIIPARGGSKRIPKKNIKLFHGKPLIAYSIEVAIKSKLFSKVIVSTDDEEIAKIARSYGADVPFLRPKELSDDFTGTGAVVNHAIEFLKAQGEKIDFICTIYATAPFLQEKYLIEAYEKLKNSNGAGSVVYSNDLGVLTKISSPKEAAEVANAYIFQLAFEEKNIPAGVISALMRLEVLSAAALAVFFCILL